MTNQSFPTANEIFFMELALEEAQEALVKGEVPIGAILVHEGQVIARAHNLIETSCDPSAHAELLCIRKAAQVLGDWRLLNTTLYTTLEPCAMCFGAMMLARIPQLIFSADDLRHGVLGSWIDLKQVAHPTHKLAIKKGLLQDQSAQLLKDFFQARRREKIGRGMGTE